jgi:hypothetical protein
MKNFMINYPTTLHAKLDEAQTAWDIIDELMRDVDPASDDYTMLAQERQLQGYEIEHIEQQMLEAGIDA